MNKTLVFLRQVFFPYPAAKPFGYETKTFGDSDTDEVVTILPPWMDRVARLIGLVLTIAGTVQVAGVPLAEWVAALLVGACS